MAKKEQTMHLASEAAQNPREDFRAYFVGLKRKLNLKPELEEVLWKHLQTKGLDTKEKFDEGIKNFGYKI